MHFPMYKILIVEDEVILASDLADRLAELGYEVAGTPSSGAEALLYAEAGNIDLVLMDIHLQGDMDGIEAAQKIRLQHRLPVVFLTSYADAATVERAKHAEPSGYLLKPFEDRDLKTSIEIALYKHQAERKLFESEERHRTILETAMDGIWLTDLHGRLLEVNETYCKMSGFSQEELLGMHISDLEAKEMQADTARHIQRVLTNGEDRFETLHRRKDGNLFDVEISVKYQTAENGRLVVFLRDITERKRLEAEKTELEELTRRLRKDESLGRMAGAVAHHFNNYLQAVIGNLELAMDDLPTLDPAVQNLLREAMLAANKAAQVSDMMRTYLGSTIGNHAPLALSSICNVYLPLLEAMLPATITLADHFRMPGPIICANASHIQQILTILVANAQEAIGNHSGVIQLAVTTVSATEIPNTHRFPGEWQLMDQAYACIEVRDSGCGILPSNIENIFDPFYSTKFTGRGLGLSVALGIIKVHNAVICVESQPEKGSCFRVYFPLAPAEILHHTPQKLTSSLFPMSSEQQHLTFNPQDIAILLVEDDDMGRSMAAAMLHHLGFTVFQAQSGETAIEIFKNKTAEIDLVLCDMTMPIMDGWVTLHALRILDPDVVFILTSGYDEEHAMLGTHTELPQAFLQKPFQMAAMKEIIRKAMLKTT